jgi:hypothetical protein
MEIETEKGLDFSEPPLTKFLKTSCFILVMLWVIFDWFHGSICIIWMAVFWSIQGLLLSPDMTLYADGIELSYFGLKRFIEWKDITHLHEGWKYYQISYRKKAWWLSLLTLGNPLTINSWRRNYRQAIDIIEDNVLG